jgi:REP element-mobilizing transposase RayT
VLAGLKVCRADVWVLGMPRRRRIEFEGAIYHVTARGNARQRIVRDDADRRRLIGGLEHAVVRYGWELLCYVVMGNHLHLLLKTPRPNLGAGMQSFLSGYAISAGRRWRRLGDLFQGRYRSEMIEDETYYWTVSAYIHLNPVRAGSAPRPEQWEWSSYPGYRDARRAQPWVAHNVMLAAWQADQGGRDPRGAYVRFVEGGLANPPPPPFREAVGGWILGSERFVARLRSQVGSKRGGRSRRNCPAIWAESSNEPVNQPTSFTQSRMNSPRFLGDQDQSRRSLTPRSPRGKQETKLDTAEPHSH